MRTGPVPSRAAGAAAEAAGGATGVVSAAVADWNDLADAGLVVDLVLAAEVLYDPSEAVPLARGAARLLSEGGTLLLADPAQGRAGSARAAAKAALEALGATVSEEALGACPGGDGWYALRAGDGRSSAAATEAVVLLRAEFAGPPSL